jgi:hypothetical protein
MVDAISIVMFIVPLMISVVFTMLAYVALKEKKTDVGGFMSSMLSAVGWFIFSQTWSYLATDEALRSIAFLWMALGIIFSVITVYLGMRMLLSVFDVKQKPKLTMEEDNED